MTGASRGLGRATAHGLACEGCRVAINSRNIEQLNHTAHELTEQCHSDVIALPGDIADPATPERLIQQTVQALGGLDILITNAGGPPPGSFDSFDDSAWQKAIELSLMSHVRLIRAALPWLRNSPAASVLAITSYSVKQPIPNLVLSNSVRAATVGLIKTLALELGADGIRFNSILPAWTETERGICIDGKPRQGQWDHRSGGNGKTSQRQRPGSHGHARGILPTRLFFWYPRARLTSPG